ncbi:hypothetical protein O2W14_15965 [Modestobacter sp. VKM Ac-2986]|uniref:hypothetical protein n=1 Tax=Modestobacter sp. VKM Ac-2986 TaxID=3004140 RepID=UPI0022ABB7D0|nr:hypothetical protein [Modestobacter sp. VKM Ac-2986]MCZ2830333.1 hypothetical protein [Modestobacter sp. VKM Ac-2986]
MSDQADQQPDRAGDGHSPWAGEQRARSSWRSAEQRDDAAEAADRRAQDRDTAARARDDAADHLAENARTREEEAHRRIREMTQRLNALDAAEADQHVHLQQAGRVIQDAIDAGADEPLAELLRVVLQRLDVQFGDVIAAGIQRSTLRNDLRHADQQLAGAADDRTAASADRAAAAADRAASAGDRADALTARRSAATHRARD